MPHSLRSRIKKFHHQGLLSDKDRDRILNALDYEWIPTKERLPEPSQQCLVIDENGRYGIGFYREDAQAWDSPNWGWLERADKVDNKEAFAMPCGMGKVIAWRKLPEPYREEDKTE